jgi:hypothetical protein
MKKQRQAILILLCVLFVLYPIKSQCQPAEVVDPGAYLLITSEYLADSFQSLVDRRVSQGFSGQLITVESINSAYSGMDIQERIKNCIKDHYDPCTPLFVALGGDDAVVPVRYCCWPDDPTETIPTDLYYSDVDGGSWDLDGDSIYGEAHDITQESLIPEVYIGRIPVREPCDVLSYTAKVIKYETVSPDGWARRILFFGGGPSDILGENRPEDFRYHDPISNVEEQQMRRYIESIQPYWQVTPFHLYSRWISPWDQNECGDYELTPERVVEKLNEGYHFIKFGGHGGFYAWTLHYGNIGMFRRSHVGELKNTIPSIVHAGGCCSGAYDDGPGSLSKDPTISEAFIRNPIGGAVIVMGHTRSLGYNEHWEFFCKETFQKKQSRIGIAFANTLKATAPDVNDIIWLDEQYMYVLLGDPAIQVRLEEESGRNIQLFLPKGCEVIDPNEMDITIRWNVQGTGFNQDDLVKLEYSPDSGSSWLTIPGAEALPYNGRSFVWKVAYSIPYGKHYRVRVSLLSDPNVSDESGRDFTICKCELLGVKVIPNGETLLESNHASGPLGPVGPIMGQPISTEIGKQLYYSAPPVDAKGLPFLFWTDLFGNILSTERTYSFTFEKKTTLITHFGQVTHYYVNDEIAEEGFASGDNLNDGLSPQTSKRHIHSLMETYSNMGCGVVVHISKGNYPEKIILTESNVGITLSGSDIDSTVIDGQSNGSCLSINNCNWCRIQVLTLTNGYSRNGGGLYINNSCPVITDCSFVINNASDCGGGAYFVDSRPILSDCVFSQNRAQDGGGIYNQNSDAMIDETWFSDNLAEGNGGAIYNDRSSPILTRCQLIENLAERGGAMHDGHSSPIAVECTFRGNRATNRGGAVCNVYDSNSCFTNCLFIENSSHRGGVIYSWQGSCPVLTNCTLCNNSSVWNGGAIRDEAGVFSKLKNCILWNNIPDQVYFSDIASRISFSNIQGGWLWQIDGNINVDPQFADPANGDYHLKSQAGRWDPNSQSWIQDDVTSSCINAGDPASPVGDEPQPNGERINMGTYGGTAKASKSQPTIIDNVYE